MKDEFLTLSTNLDNELKKANHNVTLKSMGGASQDEIDEEIENGLSNIRDAVIMMLVSYDPNDAHTNKYNLEFEILIDSWNFFTSENVTPEVAGERLEAVRLANLSLIQVLKSKYHGGSH